MTEARFYIVCYVAALLAAMSFMEPPVKLPEKGTLEIKFENYVGNELLELDKGQYKNAMGQSFTVSMFKYYVGHIRMKKADGTEVEDDQYFLVNQDDPPSKMIELKIPEGQYTGISFTLGVDSADNCSGAQSGALDPVNGMFWAWNSGYIFLKMEGHSPSSGSNGHMLEFHVGGYRSPNNAIRHITLNFNQPIVVKSSPTPLNIKADLGEIFKKPVNVDFSKLSSVADFHNATMIADNYTDLFSIEQ